MEMFFRIYATAVLLVLGVGFAGLAVSAVVGDRHLAGVFVIFGIVLGGGLGMAGGSAEAVRRVHETLHAEGTVRLSTFLKLGTRTDKSSTLSGKLF